MTSEQSMSYVNQQLKLMKEVRQNPKRFGAVPKSARNDLVFKLREQGRKWKDIQKIIEEVYEPVSIPRLHQVYSVSKLRERLGLGYIPEISEKEDLSV